MLVDERIRRHPHELAAVHQQLEAILNALRNERLAAGDNHEWGPRGRHLGKELHPVVRSPPRLGNTGIRVAVRAGERAIAMRG